MGKFVTKQEAIDDLKRVAKLLTRPPLCSEYDHLGSITSITVRHRFGSWENALKAANLELTLSHRHLWSDEEIDHELLRLELELGHKPYWSDIKRLSIIHPDTIARRRGSLAKNGEKKLALPEWDITDVLPEDGAWVSGFFDGEGCFTIKEEGSLAIRISQRADNIEVLYLVEEIMNLPPSTTVNTNESRRAKGTKCGDEARLTVGNRYLIRDRVLPFFDRFPLRGKKALEYKIFKDVLIFLCTRLEKGMYHKRYTPSEKAFLIESVERLRHMRYDPTSSSKGKAPTTP